MTKTAQETQETQKPVERVVITPPNFEYARFHVVGTEVLVVRRMSTKVKQELLDRMIAGQTATNRKVRKKFDPEATYNEARYVSPEGWDGFPASAIRNAMIRACNSAGYKMTMAKMSVFAIADGRDKLEPQIPLIRIIGSPTIQYDVGRVETGQPYVTVRPAYFDWEADIRIKYDADQFTLTDVTNLLSRAGEQVGIMEGRPYSKDSNGMGWGTFEIAETKVKAA